MPYANADGVRVYYEAHGDGPAVVLAHGTGGHHAIWWQQVPHLSRRYKVLTIDFPGFGSSQSDQETYDAHEYHRAIVAVLDHAGAEKAALVGQSLGAPPSLRVAVENPDRVAGVVMVMSVGGIKDDAITPSVLSDRAAAEKLPVLDRLLRKEFQERNPEKVFLFQQMGTFNSAKHRDLVNVWEPLITVAQIEEAITAGVHICFLGGDEDAVLQPLTYKRIKERIPGVKIEVVPGAPHSMYWESPQEFNAVLDRFLQVIYPA